MQSGVSVPVSPAVSTTYTLTVSAAGKSATAMVAVIVTGTVASAPSIQSFGASPGSVAPGGSAQLTATFSGGSGAVDNGVGAVQSGVPVTVFPTVSTTYTLTVSAAGKSVSTTVTVLVAGACIGKALLDGLVKTHLLAGAGMADASASAATWDVRSLYLAGGIFDGTAPCASCASGCTSFGHSCANSAGGCAWWGCYQYDQLAPGFYVRDFVSVAKGRGQLPWFTYYELLQASQTSEGSAEVAAVNGAAFLTRYLGDFRFLLQQIGTDAAFVQVEPDFWGYAQQVNANPHAIPAKVREAAPADCGGEEESVAGLGKCLIAMARKYAPHVRIGLHASFWATKIDVSVNTDPSLDVGAEARKLAAFLAAAGATGGDFIAVDASDRDAGYYQSVGRNTFWDPTNQTLPHFHQALTWAKALAEGLQLPVVYWQVPVGNAAQANATDHWKDNRVDYFFAHPGELAAAHIAGMLFGAGAGGMTTPETDGGNLIARVKAYDQAPQALCP